MLTVTRTYSLILATYFVLLGVCHAQPVDTSMTYSEEINRSKNYASLGENLFGDTISLLDGTISFSQEDVYVPTNSGLRLSIGRRTPSSDEGRDSSFAVFGQQWEPTIPYMLGSFDVRDGWNSRSGNNRCSSGISQPRDIWRGAPTYGYVYPKDYWNGITINLPGHGEEQLLANNSSQIVPTDGKAYKGTTKSLWRVSCLPTLKNAPGEGFSVVVPDGTTYFFDWMAVRDATDLCAGGGDCPDGDVTELVRLSDYFIYATRVVDRFGNEVTYSYDAAHPNRLLTIKSNEGSRIDIGYNPAGQISTITTGSKVWKYTYGTKNAYGFNELSSIELPDHSAWSFSYVWGSWVGGAGYYDRICAENSGEYDSNDPPDPRGVRTITMKHPAGATGEFKLKVVSHGTNNTPGSCGFYGGDGISFPAYRYTSGVPNAYSVFSLFNKKVSGTGITQRSWSYTYYPTWSSTSQCANGCLSTSKTVVSTEDGVSREYIFGNRYDSNAGQLLQETIKQNGVIVSSRANSYLANASGQPFPDNAGAKLNPRGNPIAALNRPLRSVSIQQDGASFTRAVNSFDAFVRPLSVTKSSTISGNPTRTEVTNYHDDRNLWVLGQIKSVTCTAPAACKPSSAPNGIVISQTDYGWKALPWKTYGFGKLKNTFSYDSASTLASGQLGTFKTIADGKGNTTTLTSWMRGVPRSIKYADGKAQAAVVNSDGAIASVTDENGYKTCYGYDAMGRLNKITYPSETTLDTCDTSKWAATTIVFDNNFPAAYGLPAGHWRQRITTGHGLKETLYDALWRPLVVQTYDKTNATTTAATISQVIHRYDAQGRPSFVSYPQRSLDPAVTNTWGNPAVTPNAKGAHYTYDALDRPTKVEQDWEGTGRLTTTTQYLHNVNGPYVQVTNPRGQWSRTWHQAYDQPSHDHPVTIQTSGGQYTYVTRDPLGKPTKLRRSNSNTPTGGTGIDRLYSYNAYQELCRTVEPETGATLTGYDGAGNLAWSAAGLPTSSACDLEGDTSAILARKVSRTYDARNRLKTLTFPDGRGNQTWTWTPDGLPASVSAVNPHVANPALSTYSYNRRRLLAREVLQPLGGAAAFAATYGHDANGHVSQVTYPSALTVLLSPDALGRPTRAGTYATGVSYHPNGAIKQFTYGNGIVHTLTQNVRGLPDTSKDAYGATSFLSDGYDYDQNGNVAAITDGATGRNQRGNRTMAYDGLDRLTSTVSPMFGTATYAYDALDNLTRAKVSGGSFVRDYYHCYNTKWQLAFVREGPTCTGSTPSPSRVALEYDLQGNVTDRDNVAFDFDFGNRLRHSPGYWYAYDGQGRRILSCTSGACNYQFYSLAGQRLYVDDKATNKPTEYIYLGGSLIAQRTLTRSTGVYDTRYLHTDALGSPVLATNQSRAVAERTEYEPYGRVVNRALRDGAGYTGHVEDKATAMVYMQQRYYDPGIGRFLSVDPVTANSGTGVNFNRYWYANNNPYKFFDPDGRQSAAQPACPGNNRTTCSNQTQSFDNTLLNTANSTDASAAVLTWGRAVTTTTSTASTTASLGVLGTLGAIAIGLAIPNTTAADDDEPFYTFYHSTDPQSALSFVNGMPLSADAAAARHLHGAPGFYLATSPEAAHTFGAYRSEYAVLQFSIKRSAVSQLEASGAVLQPIPQGGLQQPMPGWEFYIPVTSFPLFNSQLMNGNIFVAPSPH